jgi:hypothetical protein
LVHVEERPALSELLAIAERHAHLLGSPFDLTDDGVAVTLAGEATELRRRAEATLVLWPLDR